jgi:hypothetical protein
LKKWKRGKRGKKGKRYLRLGLKRQVRIDSIKRQVPTSPRFTQIPQTADRKERRSIRNKNLNKIKSCTIFICSG